MASLTKILPISSKIRMSGLPLPGSLEAIALLNQSGFRVAIATNQSGIARGLFDMATLNAINDKMYRALAQIGGRIDAMFYCPHAAE